MQSEDIEINETELTLFKFDGPAPRYMPGDRVPLRAKIVAFFTREKLQKIPVETITRRYDKNWRLIPP